jgi:hypothetical protein
MVASNGGAGALEERPYRWSQRWSEDPPPGTTVNAGPGMVELYLGGDQWQTIARSDLPEW